MARVDALGGDSRELILSTLPSDNFFNTNRFHRVLEMQIIIISLVENFELSLPPQTEKTRIYRKPIALMLPMAEGRRGSWMGLAVKSLEA